MAYPHKWSPISYKSSAGQRKDTGQRPMLYRWTTQPTSTSLSPSKLPLPMGDLDSHLIHGSLGPPHPSPQPKKHLDRCSRFCRAY